MRIGVSGIGRRRQRKGRRTHEKPRGGQTPRADSNGAFSAQLFSLTHTVNCLKRGGEDIAFILSAALMVVYPSVRVGSF